MPGCLHVWLSASCDESYPVTGRRHSPLIRCGNPPAAPGLPLATGYWLIPFRDPFAVSSVSICPTVKLEEAGLRGHRRQRRKVLAEPLPWACRAWRNNQSFRPALPQSNPPTGVGAQGLGSMQASLRIPGRFARKQITQTFAVAWFTLSTKAEMVNGEGNVIWIIGKGT